MRFRVSLQIIKSKKLKHPNSLTRYLEKFKDEKIRIKKKYLNTERKTCTQL